MNENNCSSCGKPKCSCKNKDFTKAVIEIDNPEQITLMRKVVVPASMGDDTTVPPEIGKYKNVLLYYEANSKSYLYSSDGIPTLLANGLTDYEEAVNLPEINGHTLLGNQTGPELGLQNEISHLEQYARYFDTVADMKAATNLVAGSFAQTLGYYSKNDGGAGLYKIRTITESDVIDETFIYEMDGGNDLIAELIIDESMNVKQFGVKADGATDNYNKLNIILSKCDVLYFPNGTYCVNTKLDVTDCFTIKGEDKSKTIIKAPNGFITWTGSKSKTITNLHINGVAVDNVNNNIGIEGGLSFGKIEDVKISNYYIAYKPLSGTWISTFQNININACTNGFNNPSLTTFNNCKLSGVTFQHLTGICFDVVGSTIEMNECNFEDCNVCIAKAPTLMNITSCFFEGNTRVLNIESGGLSSYFIIEKSRLLPTSTENLANGWLACLPTMSSVNTTTAVLEIKDCEINNVTKDTIKPFAFQGSYNQTYWGVSIGNNSFKNIKTTNEYNIYYDDLFDTTNCTNYGTNDNPTQFYSVIPMYYYQGITWLRSSLGNMQGAHRHNYALRMIGKYNVTKTSGDIVITPPKKYFGVPSQSDFPVTIQFTDGSMDFGTMSITPTEITVTPNNYDSRTTSKIIFDTTYSRRFAPYW